jgi:hypothetical protein
MRRGSLSMTLVLAGTLTGCGGTTINLMYDPLILEVALYAKQGDNIAWTDQTGTGLTTVGFPLGSPCTTTSDISHGKCTIGVPDPTSVYEVPYTCKNCTDPEIIVGSNTGVFRGKRSTTATAPTALVGMACVNNNVSIYPPTVTIPHATVATGATVEWTPKGVPPIASDWTVSGFTATICTNNPPFNAGNPTCTLINTLSAGATATYTVSSASCNNTSANGTITIGQ